MTLPASGQISFNDIYVEGGGTTGAGSNLSLKDMSEDAFYWGSDPDDDGDNGNMDLNAPYALSEFYNAEYDGHHY